MGNVNDDGWISADDYDVDIPFPGAGSEGTSPKDNNGTTKFFGNCPVCGRHVVDREKSYSCSNRDCRFALWKDNKFFQAIGKEMTRAVAEELLNCGTVKLDGCVSRRTGNEFDCYVDLGTDEEGRAQFAIRFPEN